VVFHKHVLDVHQMGFAAGELIGPCQLHAGSKARLTAAEVDGRSCASGRPALPLSAADRARNGFNGLFVFPPLIGFLDHRPTRNWVSRLAQGAVVPLPELGGYRDRKNPPSVLIRIKLLVRRPKQPRLLAHRAAGSPIPARHQSWKSSKKGRATSGFTLCSRSRDGLQPVFSVPPSIGLHDERRYRVFADLERNRGPLPARDLAFPQGPRAAS